MATNLLPFRPAGVRASATSGHRKPDPDVQKPSSTAGWWTPLFGWSSEPDYIGSGATEPEKTERAAGGSTSARVPPGRFTPEKAKQLRMMTRDTGAFHDVMYHSAIASRLASDFGNRPDL